MDGGFCIGYLALGALDRGVLSLWPKLLPGVSGGPDCHFPSNVEGFVPAQARIRGVMCFYVSSWPQVQLGIPDRP